MGRERPVRRRPVAARPSSRWGGYLDEVDRFDAAFFGISPREATDMDPQQRLALELAWEALENAGVVPGALHEHPVGVFMGAFGSDYATLAQREGIEEIGHHAVTGQSCGLIANRISYTLGLRGPSFTVDSAQSSALVAVHLAALSIRTGECEVDVLINNAGVGGPAGPLWEVDEDHW
ncbi:type I polyketide synthase PikAI [Lentzea xinjiangensis]|uniref:Type I polyketide synthase PikAI n=1 Tax=Lentzea xinjiangensis TaxID=402600 RepID=A0A1H9WFI2_9PSEU|nr:polyketide synthase [Lentzea xinjiangensis]SES32660.1 type I polyketide synthase PikAI [Lentzea xinjiangensis]